MATVNPLVAASVDKPADAWAGVWIAEDIGDDFPQGYKVDEASTTVETQHARGAFTLARPEQGWAAGDYRVEFYIDDVFVDSAKLKIVK